MIRLKIKAFFAAIRIHIACKKALKLADKTGKKYYVAHIGKRIVVGDRKEIRKLQQLLQKRTGRRFEWKDLVIAEAS